MTYRDALQIQIKALQDVYDNLANLRDRGTREEKAQFNYVRFNLPSMWEPLQRVDNALSDAAAAQEMRGDYSVNVTAQDI